MPTGYGEPTGSVDISFQLDPDTAFLVDTEPATREAVLLPGAYVRRIGAVPQTINVIEPVVPIRSFPGAYANSRIGTITGYDPATRTITAMVQLADGSVIEDGGPRKHVSLDSHFLPRTDESYHRLHAAFEPGREAFFFCHRGSTDPNEVYIQHKRPGEVKGRLLSVSGSTLTIETWQDGA